VIKDSVNRYIATLRKALRYAHFRLKLIDKIPVFELYPRPEPHEYVYSQQEYDRWLALSPEPLKSASVLARFSGLCRGEILALQKDCVILLAAADVDGFFGEIEVRRGLKRKYRRRTLKINREMHSVLTALIARSQCGHVFTSPDNPDQPLSKHCLSSQITRVKARGLFASILAEDVESQWGEKSTTEGVTVETRP
jgi:integrase